MKDLDSKSRIILENKELNLCVKALEDWIKVEKDLLHKSKKDRLLTEEIILEEVKEICLKNKETNYISFSYTNWVKIHNAISDLAIFKSKDYNNLKNIAIKIEIILSNQYPKYIQQKLKPCYSTSIWNTIRKNNKKE